MRTHNTAMMHTTYAHSFAHTHATRVLTRPSPARNSAIFELAVSQPALDMPEALWKSYIDSEIADGARAAARALYERLLARTGHVKVWLSYAAFEAAPLPESEGVEGGEGGAEGGAHEAAEGEGAAERAAVARSVYTRAERALASAPGAGANKEARVMLLEAWRAFEAAAGTAASLQSVEARLPKRVKRRRALISEDGTPAGMEEYYDYMCAPFAPSLLCFCYAFARGACVFGRSFGQSMLTRARADCALISPTWPLSFPEEGGAAPSLKILEAAYRWKQAQAAAAAAGGGAGGDAGAEEGGGGGGEARGGPGEYEEAAEEAEEEEGDAPAGQQGMDE